MSRGMRSAAWRSLRLRAPAKVNWSLEVLGRQPGARAGGYHEVRTLLQTISLSDWVTLTPADGISLELKGEVSSLAGEPPEENLAHRAAERLCRELTGSPRGRSSPLLGAHVVLEKSVPVAAGLGGGSSDAVAVLRGLRALWRVDLSDDALTSLAAELGADVSFFRRGGSALASGRGEVLAPLPDCPSQRLVLAWPERAGPPRKTARMYAALRPEHYTDGSRTEELAARLSAGHPIGDADLFNAFEAVLPEVDAAAAGAFAEARALGLGHPHLAGSGPSFFFLLPPEQRAEPLLRALDRLGLRAAETHTLAAEEAVACREQA